MNQCILGHAVHEVHTRDPSPRTQALRARIAYGMCHRKTGSLSTYMTHAPERIANNEEEFSPALGPRVAAPVAPRFCFACGALRSDMGFSPAHAAEIQKSAHTDAKYMSRATTQF